MSIKKSFKNHTYRLPFKIFQHLEFRMNLQPLNFQKLSFEVLNFFIKCARFALKCDLPRIFRGMMMHKLEILSMSYFRASDIEATNIYHLLLVFREIDTCAQSAQLIKLIYNLQENHIPTYFFGQGQASAKQCVQK